MKILILHGSRRRNGNTSILADEFMRGAKEAGHDTEKVELGALKIADCLGCSACLRNGGVCVQKDDMAQVSAKLAEADVIVLASPVYFYTWTSLMKRCLDRVYSQIAVLRGKRFYLLTAGAADDEEYFANILADFREYVGCFRDCTAAGYVLGIGAGEGGSIRNTPAMHEAFELGRTL